MEKPEPANHYIENLPLKKRCENLLKNQKNNTSSMMKLLVSTLITNHCSDPIIKPLRKQKLTERQQNKCQFKWNA